MSEHIDFVLQHSKQVRLWTRGGNESVSRSVVRLSVAHATWPPPVLGFSTSSCHALHQGDLPDAGTEPRLLRIGKFFTIGTTREARTQRRISAKHCVILAQRIPFTCLWYHHLCRHRVTAATGAMERMFPEMCLLLWGL